MVKLFDFHHIPYQNENNKAVTKKSSKKNEKLFISFHCVYLIIILHLDEDNIRKITVNLTHKCSRKNINQIQEV